MKAFYSLPYLFGICIIIAVGIFSMPTTSSAQVPQMINYQGKLTNASGAPVNDTVQMVFTIYSDSGGTTSKWSETQTAVIVEKGVFNVLLGSVNPIPDSVFDGSIRYLGVKVGADPEITPRKPMVSVPYAYRAGGGGGGGWIDDGTVVRLETSTDYVGIGTTNPGAGLVVSGSGIWNSAIGIENTGSGMEWRLATDSDQGFHIVKVTGATFTPLSISASNGNVGIGTTSPNEQLEITGNLRLPATTATVGIIKVGADRFIHNYGTGNTFVGQNAGNMSMIGYGNTANGGWALYSNIDGNRNTADGYLALRYNTTGRYNTATGDEALNLNTTGDYNTANGYLALYSNTTGYANTANGDEALSHNTTGNSNTATGYWALYSDTTGYSNTANGQYALFYETSQSNNTAVGFSAGDYYSSTNSTFLGATAYPNASGYDNSMCLGYGSRITASNQVRVGNTSVTSIGGQVGWTTLSDGRYKKSVSENVPGLAFISKLKPVTYTMDVDAIDAVLRPPRQLHEGQSQEDLKPSAEETASKQTQSQIVYTGFIAQEVEQAAQEVGYDFSGVDAPKNDKDMYGLRYAEFVVPLVKAVQEQQQMIKELQKRIEELEKK